MLRLSLNIIANIFNVQRRQEEITVESLKKMLGELFFLLFSFFLL